MILFFYNLALLVALVVGAPWWLWRMATTHKYREGLMERLGRVPRRLASGSLSAERPLIWLHAVSVGEVLAVTRLVKELESRTARAFDRHLHHHAHRPGPGSRTLWLESRLLLPARSALGCQRLSQRAPAAHAHPRRNRILAQSAARLFQSRHSRCRGQCPHLRPFLAALPKAAPPLATAVSADSGACLLRARSTPTGCSRLVACPIASPSPAISSSMCVSRRNPMPPAG